MKRLSAIMVMLVICAMFCESPLSGTTQTAKSSIKQVTVFFGRAKVTRVAPLNLAVGEQSIVFEDLPLTADAGSFRASAQGAGRITLLGLSHKVVQHLEASQTRVAELEKRIAAIERNEKELVTDRLAVLAEKKKLLLAIGAGGGEEMGREVKNGGIDVRNWEAAYGFFSNRLEEVTDSTRVLTQRAAEIDGRITLLRNELGSIKGKNTNSTRSVQVDLRLDRAGEIAVSLDYVVPNASWVPMYDARLDAANDKVELSCFAEIAQQTGEDWENVGLTLSTSRPTEGTSPGAFVPWYLALNENLKVSATQNVRQLAAENIQNMPVARVEELLPMQVGVVKSGGKIHFRGGSGFDAEYGNAAARLAAAATLSGLGELATSFVIIRKESVPSGGESVRAPINQWTLDGKMKLVSRPRNRAGAYRFVSLTNQQEAPLMPGMVNIFAESDFLGKTVLSELTAPGQDFELPFGLDNNVTVKREILSRKKNISGDKENVTETIKITIANHGKISRTLSVEEPLPISNDNRIKIRLGDILPEPLSTDVQGKASWEIPLAAGAEQAITIAYKIEYPLGMMVSGL